MKRESFIQKSISNYGNVYDYSLIPEKVDLNDGSIIEINCERHGIFQLRPDKHLYDNRECPYCTGYKISTNEFIRRSIEIHGDKYDYSKVKVINTTTKVKLICTVHDSVFLCTPSNHLRGRGCPICKESKGEIEISSYLKDNGIEYKREVDFDNLKGTGGRKLRFDFKIIDSPILIEFDGEQHYKYKKGFHKTKEDFLKQVRHDKMKNEYCTDNNLELIRISYKDIGIVGDILTERLG